MDTPLPANSVFALGAQCAGPDEPTPEPNTEHPMAKTRMSATERKEQIVKAIEEAGPLVATELADILGVHRTLVAALCKQLIGEGRIVKTGAAGTTMYRLPGTAAEVKAPADWKAPRKAKGASKAKPPVKAAKARHGGRRKGAGRKLAYGEPTKTMRVPESRASKVAAMLKGGAEAASDIECGLFSTGEISIAADGQQIRLSAARTRVLIAWLSKVDSVLKAEALA